MNEKDFKHFMNVSKIHKYHIKRCDESMSLDGCKTLLFR